MSNDVDHVFEFLEQLIKKDAKIEKTKAAVLASQFSTLDVFKNTDFLNKKIYRGDKTEIKLNVSQRKRIEDLKKFVNPNLDIKENWIKYLAITFVETQLVNIKSLSLETMNMNPFLIKALNLKTPDEVIRFNVYQTATRSITTSMGFTLESMVGHSGARMGVKGEWYDVVKQVNNLTYWIQVKSGPNDVDKDQVVHFNSVFNKTDNKSNLAKLGIVYGKRPLNTISMNHIKKYLDSWKDRLLVGKELWDFVSDENNYHKKVLKWIEDVSSIMLHGHSINDEIEKSIVRVIKEFESKYGTGVNGVKKYINDTL